MSWHVSGIGTPKALIESLSPAFERVTCDEPEQTIKAKVQEIVLMALSAYPADAAVKVSASGSQSTRAGTNEGTTHINSLNITIEPLWVFVE